LGIARDPTTNELVSIVIAARYLVRDGDAPGELTVLHAFERIDD
jgi:hypothetical protein